MSRRSVIAGGALVAAGSIAGAGTASASDHEICFAPISQRWHTLQEGTDYETDITINESERQGPTAIVVAGQDGNERSGVDAAYRIAEWAFDQGTLMVLPEADTVAVEQGTYSSRRGNVNRQMPVGQRPTSALARELWDFVIAADPDVVLDLHSSKGIWGSNLGPSGYGQAIYPSVSGNSRENAQETIEFLNERFVSDDLSSEYDFTLGNTLIGDKPKLMHKVAADLERPGYLTEVTRYNTTLEQRTEWNKAMIAHLLYQHGITTSYMAELL